MEKISWSDTFCIGLDIVDEQHKNLFDLRNKLVDCCQTDNPAHSEQFHTILAELFAYTKFHFGEEERFMQLMAYPNLQEHKKLHDQFILDLVGFSLSTAKDNSVHEKVLAFVTNWLVAHILHADMEIRDFIENHA